MKYQVRKGADHCLWWVLNPSGFALYAGQSWQDAMDWLDRYTGRYKREAW